MSQQTSNPRREDILGAMLEVMGDGPESASALPVDVRVIEEQVADGVVRQRITYISEPGDRTPAWLLRPRDASRVRRAGVVCPHQTTGVGKDEPAGVAGLPNLHYALELAQLGFVTIAPDYPSFNGYLAAARPAGYASATMKGIVNHRRALDVLASQPDVDATRLGAIGHSLGGHNALFLAAFDERVRVAVSSCGFDPWSCYARRHDGTIRNWAGDRYMPRIRERYQSNPALMPFDWYDVLEAVAPRAIFVCAPVGDGNFDHDGVRAIQSRISPIYARMGAADKLVFEFPDAGHDFPTDTRRRAYEFIGRVLQA